MIPQHLVDITTELPYRLRDEIHGYVSAVDSAASDIARQARIELTEPVREAFLFVVGVRRLWGTINGLHWLARDAGVVFETADAPLVRAGSLFLGPDADFNRQLQMLRTEFLMLLEVHELFEPVTMGQVSEVMRWVASKV